jgi:predicted ribosomally synthesized peptide with nif11-like leader
MSMEVVKRFLEQMRTDEKLRDDVVDAVKNTGDRMAAAASIAEQHGFRFTADELERVLDLAQEVGERELSEDQLDAVAGGTAGALMSLTRDELSAVAAGLKIFQQIKFAPPYVPVGPILPGGGGN